jgi:hypothetical protein
MTHEIEKDDKLESVQPRKMVNKAQHWLEPSDIWKRISSLKHIGLVRCHCITYILPLLGLGGAKFTILLLGLALLEKSLRC